MTVKARTTVPTATAAHAAWEAQQAARQAVVEGADYVTSQLVYAQVYAAVIREQA